MYPTPVWGTAGVPGYGTGPWTASVQQSYTLTGSASTGSPTGKHQGKGPEPATRTPPHTPQPGRPGHDTAPSDTEKRQKEEGTRKGDSKGTHHQQTPAKGGGEPHSRDRGGGTTHSPHTKQGRQTTPAKARAGTQTHHQHTAHTPERAHNTHPHNRHRHEPHKRTPHTKAQAPPAPHTQHTQTQTTGTQQPARGTAGPPEAARTQRRTHQARSQEWRTATPSNTRTATPNTRTGHYDTHTSTATNAQTGRHDTLTSGHTRNQRKHHRQHQRPQHPPTTNQHKKPPNTAQRPHPTDPVPHRLAPRTTATDIHAIGNTNTAKNQASTTPSPTPSPPAPTPTTPTHATAGSGTYITQANGIKHTIAGNTPPSASPPATSATGGHRNRHSR